MIKRFWLAAEFGLIFLALPSFLYLHVTRWNVHAAMWLIALGAFLWLRRAEGFSGRDLWHGVGWSWDQRKKAFLRFCAAVPALVFLTWWIAPERMLGFPLQRPWFWLLVMVLYPVLSVVPQELVFRSFFFRRYAPLFGGDRLLMLASVFVFGFAHIVFHNFVSPPLCWIGGFLFAHSYTQHRSLKWAAVEHAAYGCLVFTVGLGFYFLVNGGSLAGMARP